MWNQKFRKYLRPLPYHLTGGISARSIPFRGSCGHFGWLAVRRPLPGDEEEFRAVEEHWGSGDNPCPDCTMESGIDCYVNDPDYGIAPERSGLVESDPRD